MKYKNEFIEESKAMTFHDDILKCKCFMCSRSVSNKVCDLVDAVKKRNREKFLRGLGSLERRKNLPLIKRNYGNF